MAKAKCFHKTRTLLSFLLYIIPTMGNDPPPLAFLKNGGLGCGKAAKPQKFSSSLGV
jgi:hypothetical protein